jgi:UMF1 family MFS transporter
MDRDSESNDDRRPRRYEDEDTAPTTDRELKGWYSYGLAAEIFAVCSVGTCYSITAYSTTRRLY